MAIHSTGMGGYLGGGFSAPLLAGDAGTAQTISKIRQLVDCGWKNSFVNRSAIDIVRSAGADSYDQMAQARALYDWVLSNMYFISDPVQKEALRSPADLLEMHAGDCDDINAILLPSLLGTIGIESRLVTIAANPTDPEQFSHVYAEACIDGDWVPLDAARPGASFGAAPPRFFRREWWSLTDSEHEDYSEPGQMLSGVAVHGYPTARPALGLAGLTPSTSALITNLATDASQVATAVSGQPVVNVVGSAIGPGGAPLYTQIGANPGVYYAQSWFDEPSAIPNITNGEFLIGAAVAFFAFRALLERRR